MLNRVSLPRGAGGSGNQVTGLIEGYFGGLKFSFRFRDILGVRTFRRYFVWQNNLKIPDSAPGVVSTKKGCVVLRIKYKPFWTFLKLGDAAWVRAIFGLRSFLGFVQWKP